MKKLDNKGQLRGKTGKQLTKALIAASAVIWGGPLLSGLVPALFNFFGDFNNLAAGAVAVFLVDMILSNTNMFK